MRIKSVLSIAFALLLLLCAVSPVFAAEAQDGAGVSQQEENPGGETDPQTPLPAEGGGVGAFQRAAPQGGLPGEEPTGESGSEGEPLVGTTPMAAGLAAAPRAGGMGMVIGKSLVTVASNRLFGAVFDTVFARTDPYAEALDGIASQLYDIDGDISQILANTRQIMGTLDEMNATMGGMVSDIAELKRLIQQLHAEQNYIKLVEELEKVQLRAMPLMQEYIELCNRVQDPADALYGDKAARNAAIETLMGHIKATYGNLQYTHSFRDDLDLIHAQMYGSLTFTDARIAVDKVSYPFEHQLYENAFEAFNYGAALQAILLHLYWDYSLYEQGRQAADGSYAIDPQATAANYTYIGGLAIDHLNAQIEAAPQQGLMRPEEINSQLVLENGEMLDTYHVIINDSGQQVMIARSSRPVTGLLAGNSGRLIPHYFRSADGHWSNPTSAEELKQIFAADIANPARWLTENGGLALGNIDCFTLGLYYREACAPESDASSFAHATVPTSTPDLVFGAQLDSNTSYHNNVYFPSRGAAISVNSAAVLPIYLLRSAGSDVVPKDASGAYKPTSAYQLPQVLPLVDGDVLDLGALANSYFQNQEVFVSGSVTIRGAGQTLSNLQITMAPGAHLTLENLTVESTGAGTCALVARGAGCQLRVADGVSLRGDMAGIGLMNGAQLAVFPSQTGSPALNVTGNVAIKTGRYASALLECQNLTLNLKALVRGTSNAAPSVLSGSDCYFKNCRLTFEGPGDILNAFATYEQCDIKAKNGSVRAALDGMHAYQCTIEAGHRFSFGVNTTTKNFSETKDNIMVRLTGPTATGGTASTPWCNFGPIGWDETKYATFTVQPQLANIEDYIEVKKDGSDGVKFSEFITDPYYAADVSLVYYQYNSKIDDKKTHLYYPTKVSYLSTRFAPHAFSAERGAQAAGAADAVLATSDAATLQRQLERIAALTSDEVAHIPVHQNVAPGVRAALFRALAQSRGEVALEVMDGETALASWIFSAEGLDMPAADLDVGLRLGAPREMGYANLQLPEGARIVQFNHTGRLPGLARIVLYDRDSLPLFTGQRYGLYRIENGALKNVMSGLATDEFGDLTLQLDQCSTYALLPEGGPLEQHVQTGDARHYPALCYSLLLAVCLLAVLLKKRAFLRI